jgi:hypothetical protein
MWTKLLAAGALAAALCFAPAVAQEAPSDAQQPSAATESEGQQLDPAATESDEPKAQSSEMGDIAGWPVYSADGEELGVVTKVKQGADGKVEAIRTDIGGFLGLGAKTVEIRADQFAEEEDHILLSMSADEVKELPAVAEQ